MNNWKKIIPNLVTLCNLICGLFSVVFAFEGNLVLSAAFIFYGGFFDFFDGLSARMLKVNSELGKQLDSLADMTTFGIAPGIILFQLIYYSTTNLFYQSEIKDDNLFPAILAFLLPIFSALRLAKFNIDVRQTSSFIGLPTPAAAIFVASLPLIWKDHAFFFSTELLIGITFVLSLLLVAEIPLFSLKYKKDESISSKLNILRISLVLSGLVLFFVFGIVAIPFVVILYLILSIINNVIS